MRFGRQRAQQKVKIRKLDFEEAEKFKYLPRSYHYKRWRQKTRNKRKHSNRNPNIPTRITVTKHY